MHCLPFIDIKLRFSKKHTIMVQQTKLGF